MAEHFNCKCPERSKPIHDRAWIVNPYKWNNGSFVPAGGVFSEYSTVWCLNCRAVGRCKANYVDKLEIVENMDEFSKRINGVKEESK